MEHQDSLFPWWQGEDCLITTLGFPPEHVTPNAPTIEVFTSFVKFARTQCKRKAPSSLIPYTLNQVEEAI